MASREAITVCIPAYNAGAFIADTLRSLQAQTFHNFQAMISIDGGDAATLEACQPFLKDPRFQVFIQERRLGWVQNTNWLLIRAQHSFVSILPHDDLIHPYYLEELMQHLLGHPECSVVYCDTETFSSEASFQPFYFVQRSLRGSLFERMYGYLTQNFECVGFRSLIRKQALSELLENNSFDDFAADTLWLGKLAKQGEHHRLPYPLCKKRYHEGNTHSKWFKKPKSDQRAAWKLHCSDLLETFIKQKLAPDQKKRLIHAAEDRFRKGCFRFRIIDCHRSFKF